MGYRAYSHVIYGITVNRQKLEQDIRVRGCNHEADETKNFCAECGEPVWVEDSISIFDNLDSNGDNTLSYFYESYDDKERPDYNFMIGFKLGGTDYNKSRSAVKQPTTQMKQEILEFCKDNNLDIKEEDIKMLVYTYHSY